MVVDIVIPCRSSDDTIFALLTSISKMDRTHLGTVRLVYNPELPKNVPKTKDYPFQLEISSESTANVNIARNHGLRKCHSDLALMVDSDCVISDPKILSQYLEYFYKYPNVGVIGGSYSLLSNQSQVVQTYHWLQLDWYLNGQQSNLENSNLLGGNLAIRKSVFQNHLFNEQIRFGASETEYIYRLRNRGITTIGVPEISVIHTPEMTASQFFRKAYLQGLHTEGFVTRFQLKEPEVSSLALRHRLNKPTNIASRFYLAVYKNSFLYGQFSRKYGRALAVLALINHHVRMVSDRLLTSVELLSAQIRRMN